MRLSIYILLKIFFGCPSIENVEGIILNVSSLKYNCHFKSLEWSHMLIWSIFILLKPYRKHVHEFYCYFMIALHIIIIVIITTSIVITDIILIILNLFSFKLRYLNFVPFRWIDLYHHYYCYDYNYNYKIHEHVNDRVLTRWRYFKLMYEITLVT